MMKKLIFAALLIIPVVSFAATTYIYNVGTMTAPYGAWLNTKTKEVKYYDLNRVFYDNTADISVMQEVVKSDSIQIMQATKIANEKISL